MVILKKPEYYLHLSNIFRRVKNRNTKGVLQTNTVFKKSLEVEASDAIGKSILHTGIYDLALSETLWILAENAKWCLDIGANIGYTSLLMAERMSNEGTVTCFEPNPKIIPRLKKNLKQFLDNERITLHEYALSDKNGESFLNLPIDSIHNDGTASVTNTASSQTVAITLKRLDDLIDEETTINLLKIDVEGHELNVFKGAYNLLKRKQITHIVFEENEAYPSPVSTLLSQYGYSIKRIHKGWFGIELKNPESPLTIDAKFEATNYLATLDLEFVQEKISKFFGYTLLK